MPDVNDKQIGGNHYRSKIQHWDFVEANGLRYTEGCATKYATRNRKKHEDPRQDLEKAIHYVEKVQDLYRNGVLLPRTAPVVITPDAFAAANGLTEDEAEVVRILTFWESDPELTAAMNLLRKMIAEVEL
jgi:hypothetical protein